MELVTGVIILPQRQTMLAAKQAAEVDLLTSGKFRLGVGIGWNRAGYEALGQDFSTRGKRLEEQITLLRRLWTEQTVTVSGTFDRITSCSTSNPGSGTSALDRMCGWSRANALDPPPDIPPGIRARTGGAGQRTSVYWLRSSRTTLA